VRRPRDAGEVASLLAECAREGRRLCLRGAGRSYGDAAILPAGDVLDLTGLGRVTSFDPETGVLAAEAGVTVETLWRKALPHGYWPAVVPGTMRPTVGGMLAMNVHGKNHYRAGGFGEHAEAIDVVFPDGSARTLLPGRDDDLLRAVVGGFGLLGVVTSARLRLKRVRSGLLAVKARAVPTLRALFEEMERRAGSADYLVGWVDCFHRTGRGVLHEARHLAEGEDADPATTLSARAQELPSRLAGGVPASRVPSLLRLFASPRGMALVNAAKFRAARLRGEHDFREPHVRFAFLLDAIPGWKRIYEPGGLIQHQSFVPRERAVEVHSEILGLCRSRGILPWLGVYKKHRACPTLMAHALDGYSLALDFPVTDANRAALWSLCRDLDAIVVAAGGRFYFAKDLTASPETLRRAYPRLDAFLALKRRLDPQGVLTSALAQRLEIVAR
jgi:FAD/FMN-containing dehydrogenase